MCMWAFQLSPVGGKKGWACWVCSLGRWWSWQKQRCLTNSYLVYIWPALGYVHTTDYGHGFHVQLHADYGCFSSLVILRKITPVSLDGSEFFHASSEKRLIYALKQRQLCSFQRCRVVARAIRSEIFPSDARAVCTYPQYHVHMSLSM